MSVPEYDFDSDDIDRTLSLCTSLESLYDTVFSDIEDGTVRDPKTIRDSLVASTTLLRHCLVPPTIHLPGGKRIRVASRIDGRRERVEKQHLFLRDLAKKNVTDALLDGCAICKSLGLKDIIDKE